ncbi:tannase and feruloyl esterase [Stipitochalara longipes BDJ]|nr:tannase and feruloyl esterase [Stipitochalara longipes BDJ]
MMAQCLLFVLVVFFFALSVLGRTPQAFFPRHDPNFSTACLNFEPLKYVPNAAVNAHEFVPAGTTLQFPDSDPSCGTANQTISVDICRIALNISTSVRSGIIFESWLPRNWTGRFLATGNGGIDGCIKYDDINYGNINGFSAVGSNNGHNGTGGSAFLNNPEVLKDYVYRSLHTITEAGKNLTTAFYPTPVKKSYYLGCSGGGRQGIKAAEMFPEDFNGIVVGAPAVNFNNMTSWRASFFDKTGAPTSLNFIPASAWQGFIHDEVLNQCDTIDGVADGIIEDPTLCEFRPESLICSAAHNSTNCLNEAQVEIVRSVLSPLYGASGELVFPAMQPGSEIMAVQKLYAGAPFPYSLDWFRYVIYNTSTFDDTNFSVADITSAQALNPFHVQTYPSNLGNFTGSHKGKLLVFHGQQDQQITSFSTERFYNHLAEGMALRSSQLDEFFRFFRISGMFHCNSGPGAWMIGQSGSGSMGFDPESNVLAAMVQWVEEGFAPEAILGTKFVNDAAANGVERSRRHCRFPYRNTYIGGNASLPQSWECIVLDFAGH